MSDSAAGSDEVIAAARKYQVDRVTDLGTPREPGARLDILKFIETDARVERRHRTCPKSADENIACLVDQVASVIDERKKLFQAGAFDWISDAGRADTAYKRISESWEVYGSIRTPVITRPVPRIVGGSR